jgi:hypothetical protein
VRVPVMASLNGTSSEAWLRIATDIEQAGRRRARETTHLRHRLDPGVGDVGRDILGTRQKLKRTVRFGRLKLSPHYLLGNVARRLDEASVTPHPVQPVHQLDISPNMTTPRCSMRPRGTAAAAEVNQLLHGRVHASIAITGGVGCRMTA